MKKNQKIQKIQKNSKNSKVYPMPIILETVCDFEDNIDTEFIKYTNIIKNFETLDKEMITNIQGMSDENKMEIIILFNEVLNVITAVIK